MKKPLLSLFLLSMLLLELPFLAAENGDPKKGQRIFESLTCVDCHEGGNNSIKPDKPLKGERFADKYKDDAKIEQLIRKGVFGSSMPSFGKDVISDAAMKDLIAYIRSLTPAVTKNGNEKDKSGAAKKGSDRKSGQTKKSKKRN